MKPEQIQKLREMAEQRVGDIAFLKRCMKEPNTEGLEEIADLLCAAADIADAYRWRPVAELTEEDWSAQHLLVFAVLHADGTMDTADPFRSGGRGYTHFLRLPKLEAL
jgi:hypothetical protein